MLGAGSLYATSLLILTLLLRLFRQHGSTSRRIEGLQRQWSKLPGILQLSHRAHLGQHPPARSSYSELPWPDRC